MTTGKKKQTCIFLADDDADDCALFKDALNELSIQTQLTITNDGDQLLTALDEKVPPLPHVIFLDLNMPRKSGFVCLEEIRRTPKLKNIPVVIFSTSANPTAIDTTYSLGANYFICKPRSFELLKKAIEIILSFDYNLLLQQPTKEHFFVEINKIAKA